jgi:hypothetical protein
MAVPILFELNQELTRLFVAGSRLASGDPRIKKFIAPLKKYGEKSPVFQRLAQHIEELLEIDAALSAQKLIETEMFLLSVLSTQGDTSLENTVDIDYAEDAFGETKVSYRTLSPLIEALTTTGSGRLEIIESAFNNDMFNDPRIYKPAADALGDKYGEIADYMANTVVPSMSAGIVPYLLDGYDVKGAAIDGRRLAVMHKIKGEAMLSLAEEAAENGSAAVKAEAVKIMGDYPKYEQLLLSMLGEKAKAVREEVMKSLVKMNSKEGIDKLIEIYSGDKKKSETVLSALSYGTSGYLTDELLRCAYADYEILKNEIDNYSAASKEAVASISEKAQRLRDDITALFNKHTDEAAEFFQMLLDEEYLVKVQAITAIVTKRHSIVHHVGNATIHSYHSAYLDDYVLSALYHSGKGDDFIWRMFETSQFYITSKNKKPKGLKRKDIPPMLNNYAFSIGAKRLDPEEFYELFFETGLFEDLSKVDYYIFQKTFLLGENNPPYSPKIVRYLASGKTNHDYMYLATQIVKPDDYATLDLMAEHLKTTLSKNPTLHYNYEILKRLGEFGHKDFKGLYELFCTAKHYTSATAMAYLERFLKND